MYNDPNLNALEAPIVHTMGMGHIKLIRASGCTRFRELCLLGDPFRDMEWHAILHAIT